MTSKQTTDFDEGFTPADKNVLSADVGKKNMPRRSAIGAASMAGVAGMAGLVALSSPRRASAHANQRGLMTRVRRIYESARVQNDSNQLLRMVCPRPKSNENVYVMGGGYSHSTNNPAFVIKTNGPDTTRSWTVDGHNVNTRTNVTLSGFAICAYFRK